MTYDSFGCVLRAHAQRTPAAVALSYPGESLTWQELERRSTLRALQLRSKGAQLDDIVLIAMPNGVVHHEMTFGAWKAGATPCVIPAKLPNHELQQIIQLAQPRVLVRGHTDTSLVEQLDPAAPILLDDQAALPDLTPSRFKAVASGGSTGRPKLIVAHEEARLNEHFQERITRLGLPRGGVVLNPGPLYHNAPLLFSSLALLAGAKVVGMARFDAEECLRLIAEHRVSWVCLVPTMMHRIWNLPPAVRERYDLSSLRTVWHLGAACPPWLKRAWIDWLGAERILELYAGTESPGTVITGQEWLRKPGSVGRVPPGTLSVLRENGEICGPREVGEIFFPSAAKGGFHYIGEAVKCDLEGRFTLGDLGYVDEDGYLFLADRRTDLIIRGGANIYPAEVESALEAHAAVASAVVVGLPCEEYGQRVHGILELQPGCSCALEEIDQFARSQLSGYKCPESYEIVRGPLRNEAGKVRRSALRQEREEWLKTSRRFQTFVSRPPRGPQATG